VKPPLRDQCVVTTQWKPGVRVPARWAWPSLVFADIIMIAILGLALDACLRGLLLLADPSRRR
jgi:hypothetical protein